MLVNRNVKRVIIFMFVFILGIFLGMVFTRSEPFREILVGTEDEAHPNQINWSLKLESTSREDLKEINTIEPILWRGTTILNPKMEANKPDLFLQISGYENKIKYGLADVKIWFTSDGAIIGIREGEDWNRMNYKILNKGDTRYIKTILRELKK